MRADLHTHSRYSDGTQSPAELVAEAAAVGLDVLALTDHDTTRGWAEAASAAQSAGVGLVRGMEVSCRWDGISVHILCYLHDPEGAEITHTVEQARHDRLTRLPPWPILPYAPASNAAAGSFVCSCGRLARGDHQLRGG